VKKIQKSFAATEGDLKKLNVAARQRGVSFYSAGACSKLAGERKKRIKEGGGEVART